MRLNAWGQWDTWYTEANPAPTPQPTMQTTPPNWPGGMMYFNSWTVANDNGNLAVNPPGAIQEAPPNPYLGIAGATGYGTWTGAQAAQTQAATLRQQAEDVSWKLMLSKLSRDQRDYLQNAGGFIVRNARTQRAFFISASGALAEIMDGMVRATYCVWAVSDTATNSTLPTGDQILAKKLLVEHDLDRLLKVAVASPRW